jgi:hypothetical protein
MRLSMMSCASVMALAAFVVTASGAVAAEQKGQACDVRGVHVPGCDPGAKSVQPLTKFPTAPESRHDSNQSGRDPQHHRSDPPPPTNS